MEKFDKEGIKIKHEPPSQGNEQWRPQKREVDNKAKIGTINASHETFNTF